MDKQHHASTLSNNAINIRLLIAYWEISGLNRTKYTLKDAQHLVNALQQHDIGLYHTPKHIVHKLVVEFLKERADDN